jgi:hypothetical protein
VEHNSEGTAAGCDAVALQASAVASVEEREVIFAVEGERKPLAMSLRGDVTVSQFLERVKVRTDRVDLQEVLIEDEEVAVEGNALLFERIIVDEFKLVHVATAGKIKVDVTFGKTKDHNFAPSATMEKIIVWAIAAFELVGEPADFQLKLGDEVLAAGQHLGQVADGRKTVCLALVMKIKPQG